MGSLSQDSSFLYLMLLTTGIDAFPCSPCFSLLLWFHAGISVIAQQIISPAKLKACNTIPTGCNKSQHTRPSLYKLRGRNEKGVLQQLYKQLVHYKFLSGNSIVIFASGATTLIVGGTMMQNRRRIPIKVNKNAAGVSL